MNKKAKKEIDTILDKIPKNVAFTFRDYATALAKDMSKKYELDFNEVYNYIMQKLSGH